MVNLCHRRASIEVISDLLIYPGDDCTFTCRNHVDEYYGARFLARRHGDLITGYRVHHALADEEQTPVTDSSLTLVEPERAKAWLP